MYPFDRYMRILKEYVRNQNRHESCIVECYTYEEVIEFYNEYLSNVEVIGLPKRGCTNVTDGFCKIGQIVITVNKNLMCQAHIYVLNNTDEVQSYINDHMDYIRCTNPTKSRRKK